MEHASHADAIDLWRYRPWDRQRSIGRETNDYCHFPWRAVKRCTRPELFPDFGSSQNRETHEAPEHAFPLMERVGTPWGSEVERSRHIQWQGQWRRVKEVAAALRSNLLGSVRPRRVRCRHGETKPCWVCTKVIQRKRDGRQRCGIVQEHAALEEAPHFLWTDALYGESGRVIETWRARWVAEILHEFGKEGTGLEVAQGRKEEAVKRHVRLQCVA